MDPKNEVFVFGSNLAGRHGKGSAREAAIKHGAVYGKGWGRQGNSYAIPTKGRQLEILSIPTIREYIDAFILYAHDHPELTFNIVDVGCGHAGYTAERIAPMFRRCPPNCKFLGRFKAILDRLPK